MNTQAINTALSSYDPLVSEYDNAEHEARHTAWLQAKVAKSLADPRPAIPHDEVMAKMDTLIARYLKKAA